MSREYHRGGLADLRAPCPVLNSLANHGLIARSGRNITKASLLSALDQIGLASSAGKLLCEIAFKVHTDDAKNPPPGTAAMGFRDPDQVNEHGEPVFNLDQVGRANAMEHDISLTRQDRVLGDHMDLDEGLYKRLLACPREKKAFRIWDLGRYRKVLHAEHKRDNQELVFGVHQHASACLEVAAMQCVFGNGIRGGVPMEYYEAVFRDERLPFDEGWRPRKWMFLVELVGVALCVSLWAF